VRSDGAATASRSPAASGRAPRRANGFTLIEVMLAVAIFGGILGAIYASWSAVLRASRAGLDAAADAQRARVAVRCLEEALWSAQMFQDGAGYFAFLTDTSSDFAFLSLAARFSKSFPGGGIFDDTPVRRVTFVIDRGPTGLNQLVMRQEPLLAKPQDSEPPYEIVLAKEVHLFTLEFMGAGNNRRWLTEWTQTNMLPRLVRFTLGLGPPPSGPPQPHELVSRLIAIPSMAVPRSMTMGAATPQPVPPGAAVPPGGLPPQTRPPGSLTPPSPNPGGGQ
jgi:prepilin-type N-terminal cleavage/methylation domain-containing protein